MKVQVVIAVVIPVIGLMGMVARAELATHAGPAWTIPIRGYDPRDLLRGRYLRYRFDFDWEEGASTCGEGDQPELGCCLCLTGIGGDPSVRQMTCDEASDCDGWLRADQVAPPLRYFVPETSALDLEKALRIHQAAVSVTSSSSGGAAIGELTLDGRPWREVVQTTGGE
jgi:hypothetical protein